MAGEVNNEEFDVNIGQDFEIPKPDESSSEISELNENCLKPSRQQGEIQYCRSAGEPLSTTMR